MNRAVSGMARDVTRMLLQPRRVTDDELHRNLNKKN